MEATIAVSGMTCDHCVSRVRHALAGISGVKNVIVDLQKQQAVLESDAPVPFASVIDAMKAHPHYKVSEPQT